MDSLHYSKGCWAYYFPCGVIYALPVLTRKEGSHPVICLMVINKIRTGQEGKMLVAGTFRWERWRTATFILWKKGMRFSLFLFIFPLTVNWFGIRVSLLKNLKIWLLWVLCGKNEAFTMSLRWMSAYRRIRWFRGYLCLRSVMIWDCYLIHLFVCLQILNLWYTLRLSCYRLRDPS